MSQLSLITRMDAPDSEKNPVGPHRTAKTVLIVMHPRYDLKLSHPLPNTFLLQDIDEVLFVWLGCIIIVYDSKSQGIQWNSA
jgi:hypothetical protein